MNGYYRSGGRSHSPCVVRVQNRGGSAEIHTGSSHFWVNAKDVTVIKDNERFCPILWAGGWDEYVVDVNQVREMTPEEIADNEARVKKGWGSYPVTNGYLLGLFCPQVCQKNQCVKIVSHVAGGD